MKKNNDVKVYKAEEALEKLNHWYKIIEYYTANTSDHKKARDDFDYIRDAMLDFNKDKHVDRLRFAKKFKALFDKQNKELTQEVFETKKELFDTKIEIQMLEKELKKEKKDG